MSAPCGDIDITEFSEDNVSVVSCPVISEPIAADTPVDLEMVVENRNDGDAEVSATWYLPNESPPDSPVNPVLGSVVNARIASNSEQRLSVTVVPSNELPDYVDIPGSYELAAQVIGARPYTSTAGQLGVGELLPEDTSPALQSAAVGVAGAAGWAIKEFLGG